MNAGGGLASITHGAHDQIGAAREVATGKHARDIGHLICVHDHAAPGVERDFIRTARSRKGAGSKP